MTVIYQSSKLDDTGRWELESVEVCMQNLASSVELLQNAHQTVIRRTACKKYKKHLSIKVLVITFLFGLQSELTQMVLLNCF